MMPTPAAPAQPPPAPAGCPVSRVLVEDVIAAVADESGHTRDDLVSDRRQRSLVIARQLAMVLASTNTRSSLSEIGRRLRRDHTTVIHGIRSHQRRAQSDPSVHDLAVRTAIRLRERVAERVRRHTQARQHGWPMMAVDYFAPDKPVAAPKRDPSGRTFVAAFDVPPEVRAWFAANDARFRAHIEQLAGGAA